MEVIQKYSSVLPLSALKLCAYVLLFCGFFFFFASGLNVKAAHRNRKVFNLFFRTDFFFSNLFVFVYS